MVTQRNTKVSNIGNFGLPEVANIVNFGWPEVANIGNFGLPILATLGCRKLPILATFRLSNCCHKQLVTYLHGQVLMCHSRY